MFFALSKSKFLYVKSFYIRFALVKGITSSAAKPEAGRNILTLEGIRTTKQPLPAILSTSLHCRPVLGCTWAVRASCSFHLSHHWIHHLACYVKQPRYGQGVGPEATETFVLIVVLPIIRYTTFNLPDSQFPHL